MCISNPYLHTLHKRNTKSYATCVNFSTLWTFCTRILNTSNTICVNIGTFHSLFALSTEKFTQPTKILRDRRSHRLRQIWSLVRFPNLLLGSNIGVSGGTILMQIAMCQKMTKCYVSICQLVENIPLRNILITFSTFCQPNTKKIRCWI